MMFANTLQNSNFKFPKFNTSNFELDRPLPKAKNKEVVGLMKDELGTQIMK